ncbi:MAG: Glu-tRNA(Gln) amidotransferase subunit GatE [Candidatus Thermoplasmatota archaeon]|nr:Glu-tRNA(Gln) amidotransferase subunit GatE [Candidatus Thermoplasmatota archaeon]
MKLKAGLEVHQQLDCGKLFCNCDYLESGTNGTFNRVLHATSSEMGDVDVAAEAEGIRKFTYHNRSCNCLVYTDEEPPRGPNEDAIEIAVQFARLTDAEIIEEVQFMRKIVVDGSNTSGFQRTGLIATGGYIEYEGGILELDQICLEEDSCRHGKNRDEYLLDRLGIPLLEITTKPQLKKPEYVKNAARALGRLLRACKVRRGLGTIRQDVNVSIDGGQRVELKGFQDLATMSKVVENEMRRQENLSRLKKGDARKQRNVTDLLSKKRGTAIACKLIGWRGLLGTKMSEEGHLRMGRELADHAIKAGIEDYSEASVSGLMHSDELPAYGITEEETQKMGDALKCGEDDAFVLIFGEEATAKKALDRVIQRVMFHGVPQEVRKVTPDGFTRYLRPMPGASRMYPETDIGPVSLHDVDVTLPKTLDQRENELPINDEESRQMVSGDLDLRFHGLMEKINDPKNISRVLLHTLPNLTSTGHNFITDEDILKVLFLVKEGKIAKEGIEDALIQTSKGNKIEIGNDNIDSEVQLFIDRLVQKKIDFVRNRGMAAIGPLMGTVMSEFRGKMDGAKINALLIERIEKEI